MAYFNKTDFRELLKLWRKVLGTKDYPLLLKDDEWLMKQFLPIRFISDIRYEITTNWERKEEVKK